jgi:hypothetical protein
MFNYEFSEILINKDQNVKTTIFFIYLFHLFK